MTSPTTASVRMRHSNTTVDTTEATKTVCSLMRRLWQVLFGGCCTQVLVAVADCVVGDDFADCV